MHNRYRKGTDTLDVWFDSGTAWKATWKGRQDYPGSTSPTGALQPSDLVLEGSDQHRYDERFGVVAVIRFFARCRGGSCFSLHRFPCVSGVGSSHRY
jgi:hypothetical protein